MANKEKREKWAVNDSSFNSYVSMVNFREGSALDCITRNLANMDDNSVLDIAGGSNGVAVSDLIDSGLVNGGVFTNFTDQRNSSKLREDLDFVPGDLAQDATWNKIKEIQTKRFPIGFSLVLHRPYGGLQDLQPSQYVKFAEYVIDMIRPGGVFYSQIPSSPYQPTSNATLNYIFRSIKQISDVDNVEVSVKSQTLAEHNFCLIYKKS